LIEEAKVGGSVEKVRFKQNCLQVEGIGQNFQNFKIQGHTLFAKLEQAIRRLI